MTISMGQRQPEKPSVWSAQSVWAVIVEVDFHLAKWSSQLLDLATEILEVCWQLAENHRTIKELDDVEFTTWGLLNKVKGFFTHSE